MEETFKQAFTRVPEMAVLVLVVYFFLRHIEHQRKSALDERSELVKAIQSGTLEHLQARREMHDVIKENTASNTAVSIACAQMAEAVRSGHLHTKKEDSHAR